MFNGGSDEKHYRVVELDGKPVKIGGVSIKSKASPGSAARKLLTSIAHEKGLHKMNKLKMKKVKFSIQEYTQGSKHKVYGPYVGYFHEYTKEELKKSKTAKGKQSFKMKPIVKLAVHNKHKGGENLRFSDRNNLVKNSENLNRGYKGLTFENRKKAFEPGQNLTPVSGPELEKKEESVQEEQEPEEESVTEVTSTINKTCEYLSKLKNKNNKSKEQYNKNCVEKNTSRISNNIKNKSESTSCNNLLEQNIGSLKIPEKIKFFKCNEEKRQKEHNRFKTNTTKKKIENIKNLNLENNSNWIKTNQQQQN